MPSTTLRWRLASSFPKSLDALVGPSEIFAKLVGAMTGGKFTITVHPAGELVPAFGVVDAVQNGTVECCHTAPYYFFGKDDTFALGTAIPFGLNSRQLTAWMFEGNGLKLMREFLKSYNIINFPMGNTGAQMGGWYRKEIKSLADLKGLKMRTAGIAGKVQERLGVVTQSIPAGEIYTALEKGTIDAVEFVGPYDDYKLGFYKVAPNYYYPGWWEGSAQTDLYVNIKSYEALSAEYKAMIEAASAYAHVIMQANYDAKNPIALKQLVAAGAKLRRFPKDVMEAAFKEANGAVRRTVREEPPLEKDVRRLRQVPRRGRTCGSASPRPVSTTSCSRRSCKRVGIQLSQKTPRGASHAGFFRLCLSRRSGFRAGLLLSWRPVRSPA